MISGYSGMAQRGSPGTSFPPHSTISAAVWGERRLKTAGEFPGLGAWPDGLSLSAAAAAVRHRDTTVSMAATSMTAAAGLGFGRYEAQSEQDQGDLRQ